MNPYELLNIARSHSDLKNVTFEDAQRIFDTDIETLRLLALDILIVQRVGAFELGETIVDDVVNAFAAWL